MSRWAPQNRYVNELMMHPSFRCKQCNFSVELIFVFVLMYEYMQSCLYTFVGCL